ncbi:MAG: CHAT domain-containing protein [Cyanobacteriota bacterium]
MTLRPSRPSWLTALVALGVLIWPPLASGGAAALPLSATKPSASRSAPAPAPFTAAVLRVGFSEAKGRTTAPGTDAFLDITVIPAQGEVFGYRREVSIQGFNQLLRRFYAELAAQASLQLSEPGSPARELHSILLQPVAEKLRQLGVTTLLISADAGLQAVPFAALHDGQTFFGERFGFALTPALGLTRLALSPQTPNAQLLAAGASQFQGLSPLPLVPQELDQISKGRPASSFLNRDFTPQLLLEQAGQSQVSRVHVATHAEFLPGGPAAARLYTGVGPMSLKQLAELRRRRGAAPLDLSVLSACRTALGDADSELGFAGLALQAGARSAMGSLWYVDDVATSALFVQFYRYLDQGLTKAKALQRTRQAMASGAMRLVGNQVVNGQGEVLLTGLTSAEQRRIAAGLQHPFYWAGIQLLGSPW